MVFLYRFILLRDPKNIKTNTPTLSGVAVNPSTNETLNLELQNDFNSSSASDNPFSYFPTAIDAAFFWINGDWVQRNAFNYWAVEVLTLFASIFLVIVLQQM